MKETVSVIISADEIDRRLSELAEDIKRDYAGKTITLVCALKGAVIFMADLARKLDNNVEFDFLKASSYGDERISNGNVTLSHKTEPLTGKHVLLIEDIVDTGHTLVFLRNHITAMNPATFKICALLDKPDRRQAHEAKYDYLGFSIPDIFIVGYGLDYAQRYRNLPYIGGLSFTEE
jgi:hypoxanthine phosphoribosyltransferase